MEKPTCGRSPIGEQRNGVIDRHRRHRPDRLAAHPERLSAGRDDREPGARHQQSFGDPCSFGDDVLAVVQHDQRLLIGQMIGDAIDAESRRTLRHQRAVGDPDGAGDGVGHGVGRAEWCQIDEPHVHRADVGRSDFDSQASLACTARADHGDQPICCHHRRERGDVVDPSDETAETLRHVRVMTLDEAGRREVEVERWVVIEYRRLQGAQLRAWVQAQFLQQHVTRVPEGTQRFGLPPGAVQGEHQEPVQPFAHRVRGSQRAKLGDDLGMAAQSEVGLQTVLQRVHAQFVQTSGLAVQHAFVAAGPRVRCRSTARAPAATSRRLGPRRHRRERAGRRVLDRRTAPRRSRGVRRPTGSRRVW